VSVRVGVVPRWQFIDRPQSLALIALDHVREWCRLDPELQVSIACPRDADGAALERWFAPVLAETYGAQVSFEPTYATVSPRLVGFVVDHRLADFADGVDVVVSAAPALALQLRRLVSVGWVNWQMWSAVHKHVQLRDTRFWGEYDLAGEVLAAAYGDVNVWESQLMLRQHRASRQRWLREVAWPREVVVPNGVQVPQVAAAPHESTLLWAGNTAISLKGWPQSLRVLEAVWRLTGCRVVCSTPTVFDERPREGWTVYERCGREEFVGLLGSADVFVCNSRSETYGVGWLEMLGTGLLGVFRESWWVRDMLPSWYPLVASSQPEQVEMTVAALKGGPVFDDLRRRAVEWVGREHSLTGAAARMLTVIRETEAQRAGAVPVAG
jgi:hypothetical protein